ncbi:MAG: SUMF1/EgtB/PvdO family nonheme iron enzyme [Vicingaceae bacterium]|nr:SUMF1/EgtB/PvdO family nonheme iron enzyme [Vicingaceae bacterium]
MRPFKLIYYILFVTAIVVVLSSFIKKDKVKDFSKETPPGTTKIADNLFIDKAEVSNFSYLEYQFWLKIVFGKDSDEFLSSQLDTLVWDSYLCLSSFYNPTYFIHPAYKDFPVVGITQQQAIAFCKWRADRVFEIYLIRAKILEHQPNQNAENYFSIENYYNGKYNNTPPDLRYNIYPEYRLPTKEEWLLGKDFFKNNPPKKVKKHNPLLCRLTHQLNDSLITDNNYNVEPCRIDSSLISKEPLLATYCPKNEGIAFHFYGNASEWLAEENKIIGGNWRDTTDTHFDIPQQQEYPSEYVGFRCVATWKKYEKN